MNREQRRYAYKMLKREHRDLHRRRDVTEKSTCPWCVELWRSEYIESIRRAFIDARWMDALVAESVAVETGDLGVLWEV
ncbi:hypothetical protein LCGC14_2663660 [marine sediment metagenome]|uniref:Uncharacterized protein n=1 Tax=marine sediment metagenome TaxID=412755 RepID=A0A0F9ADN2_9ZZZZ